MQSRRQRRVLFACGSSVRAAVLCAAGQAGAGTGGDRRYGLTALRGFGRPARPGRGVSATPKRAAARAATCVAAVLCSMCANARARGGGMRQARCRICRRRGEPDRASWRATRRRTWSCACGGRDDGGHTNSSTAGWTNCCKVVRGPVIVGERLRRL